MPDEPARHCRHHRRPGSAHTDPREHAKKKEQMPEGVETGTQQKAAAKEQAAAYDQLARSQVVGQPPRGEAD